MAAFVGKTIITYFAVKKSVKGRSPKLTTSMVLFAAIFVYVLSQLTVFDFHWTNYKYIGLILVTIGFIMGIIGLVTIKNSWRIGIKYEQRTELITTGIYSFSRNPCFLSYYIMFLGYIFVFPSIILIALYLSLLSTIHSMILDEEKYLQSVHGQSYLMYRIRTHRYMTF